MTTVPPSETLPPNVQVSTRSSGLKNLRAAFGSKRKESKFITVEYLPPAGSGEPEVDASGVDCRDVLEETGVGALRPVVRRVWPFEKGMEAFRPGVGGSVVRLIN